MTSNIVPIKFIDEFINYLPASMLDIYGKVDPNITLSLKTHVHTFFDTITDLQEEKVKIYNYFYYIKKTYLKEAKETLSSTNQSKKDTPITINALLSNAKEITHDKKQEHLLLKQLETWAKNQTSLTYEFPLFLTLKPARQRKAAFHDFNFKLIEYIESYYSGNIDFIFNKSTAFLISHSFFGDSAPINQTETDQMIFTTDLNANTEYYNNQIRLFIEDDARIFNNLYNHTFTQLLSSKVVKMSLSDLTFYTYGNRFKKNKLRIKERLLNMHKYGIRRSYVNELNQHVDERIVFLPEIRVIEDGYSIDVEIEFSTTLRDKLLTNLMVNYASTAAIPSHEYKEKYSYLLLQVILELRVLHQIGHSENFNVTISYDDLSKKIQFKNTKTICNNILPALEELKKVSEYLIDYRLNTNDAELTLKTITTDELNYIKQAHSNIKEPN